MSTTSRVVGAAAGVGLAAVGTAWGLAQQSRRISRRISEDPDEPTQVGGPAGFGSLRSAPVTVVADDGVPLHVEVDELDEHGHSGDAQVAGAGPGSTGHRAWWRWRTSPTTAPLTLVFVHGYCLTMDCWHFQRAAYRGRVRSVFYDQRSHGRSGRSSRTNSTIDQLGADLRAVIDTVAPDGPIVLVGHSMGGMSIIAFAEQHPEVLGERIVGVALVSTTAGGIDPGRILLPLVPARLSGELTGTAVRTLMPLHRGVDSLRRIGTLIARIGTDVLAFGTRVPASYVDFADSMLSSTPFEVVGEFFPSFRGLDLFETVEVLGRVPVSVICGTSDRLTSIGHSRKLASRIPGSTLVEVEGAGHLVLLECHDQVTDELDRLIAASVERLTP